MRVIAVIVVIVAFVIVIMGVFVVVVVVNLPVIKVNVVIIIVATIATVATVIATVVVIIGIVKSKNNVAKISASWVTASVTSRVSTWVATWVAMWVAMWVATRVVTSFRNIGIAKIVVKMHVNIYVNSKKNTNAIQLILTMSLNNDITVHYPLNLSVVSIAKAYLCLRNPSIIISKSLSHYSSPYTFVTLTSILLNSNRAEVAVVRLLWHQQTPHMGNDRRTIFTIVYLFVYPIRLSTSTKQKCLLSDEIYIFCIRIY